MTDDPELLRRFVEEGSQEAFGELVLQRVNFVYTAALRQVGGDSHMAEDVTQAVFLELAREAPRLVGRRVLAGWLYTATRMLAKNAVRAHRRWRRREQEANTMTKLLHDSVSDADWERLRPVLDEAMHELDESDREAIILRYFDNHPYAEVGAQIGLNENTARMRVDRALEKLRGRLLKRGVTSTAVALGTALTAQAVTPAPTTLAASSALSALSGAMGAGGATFASGLSRWFSAQSLLSAGVVSLVGFGLFLIADRRLEARFAGEEQSSQQTLVRVREENRRLARAELKSVADEAQAPEPDSLARARFVMELVESGLLGSFVWPSPPLDSFETAIRDFSRVLGLAEAEAAALQEVAETGYRRFLAAVTAQASIQRNGDELVIALNGSEEARDAYDMLQRDIAGALGAERYQYYQSLRVQATLEKLFKKWGLEPVKITVMRRINEPGQVYVYHTSRVGFERGNPGEEREALLRRLGPIAAFFPADF